MILKSNEVRNDAESEENEKKSLKYVRSDGVETLATSLKTIEKAKYSILCRIKLARQRHSHFISLVHNPL
jgi:hypothetical protein